MIFMDKSPVCVYYSMPDGLLPFTNKTTSRIRKTDSLTADF